MDRFGLNSLLSFEDRVNTVAEMCRRGHAGRMVLSHDAACFMHWLPKEVLSLGLPQWHYLHIHNDVIPALKQKGVTEEQLHTMLVKNPRRIFEQQGAY
jgi:phosphotriesterase-related protein